MATWEDSRRGSLSKECIMCCIPIFLSAINHLDNHPSMHMDSNAKTSCNANN